MSLRVFCLTALLFVTTVHAQQPGPDEEAMTPEEAAQTQMAQEAAATYFTRAATGLAAKGGARELAFAATLLPLATSPPPTQAGPEAGGGPSQPSPRDPRVDEWRGLASARAGKDVVANAMLMPADSFDGSGAAQARRQGIERWQRLEPDNLAPRLFENMPADAWLSGAAAYTRNDLHYYEQARWMQSALRAYTPSPAEGSALTGIQEAPVDAAAVVTALGILSAMPMPALQPLFEACRGDALASTPTRRSECRHVGQVMADASDTSLGTSVGIRLLDLTATTAEERAEAVARRRRFDWQMSQWGRLSSGEPIGGAEQFERLLRDPVIRNEQDLIERVLKEGGVALDPPAGWTSPWQH